MRTPEEIARDADALVPWRRTWLIIGVVLAVVVGVLVWGILAMGEALGGIKELADWVRSVFS